MRSTVPFSLFSSSSFWTIAIVLAWTGRRSAQAFLTSSTRPPPSHYYTPQLLLSRRSCTVESSSSRLYNQQDDDHGKNDSTNNDNGGSKPAAAAAIAATTAQNLIDRAARIRAEIAALEGKSVEQVQEEALEKKRRETTIRDGMLQQRVENELLHRQKSTERFGRALNVPTTRAEMIQQAARAIERAVSDGRMRQTIRLALLESEGQTIYEANNNMWPGGAAQMSRMAAKPTTRALFQELRLMRKDDKNKHDDDASDSSSFQSSSALSRKKHQVTVQDVWDFDGSAMVRLLSSNGEEEEEVLAQALVFANTDVKYTHDIQTLLRQDIQQQQLILLVNPFWRDLDSWGINILAPGAKRLAREVIFDDTDDPTTNNGGGISYETYSCRRFQCRGEECVAIRAYPYDWQIFAYLSDQQQQYNNNNYYSDIATIRLGESKDEPRSEYVTELLNQRPEFKLSRTMRQMKR